MPTTRRYALIALYALPLLFLACFFLYPLARILQVSFYAQGGWNLAGILAELQDPYFWRLLWFTTWQAAASTALTLAIGLPLAFVFAHYEFPGKSLLRALTTIPFVMPTVVVAAAFTTLIGRNGVVNLWLQDAFNLAEPPIAIVQTIWIILIAHAFYNVSVIIRAVGGFWAGLNPSMEEAAAVLGAARRQRFREITLPLLLPSIVAAALLVFLFCFTSFGVVLILGGLEFATIEVEIYRQAISLFNLPIAAFLSLVQMALTFTIMAIYTQVQARASRPLEMRPQARAAQRPQSWSARLILALSLGAALTMLLAPLLALAWRSVTLGSGDTLTLEHYRALTQNPRQSAFFVPPLVAVRNSLIFATATMFLSLFLGIISAYLLARPRTRVTALLDPIFLLPLGTSAVTLGLGYILAMGPLRTSLWLVPVAHTLIAAPFVVRTFLPALRSLDPRLRESAAVLGAPPLRTWLEVDVPMLFRAGLVAATFAFTISLGEFGASLLVSRPDVPTMPVVIYRLLGRPGVSSYGQALAMSTILMAVAAASLVMIERFRIGEIGEF